MSLTKEEINKEKEEASKETSNILRTLENDCPGVVEGLSSAIGAGAGGAGSLAALSSLGAVSGLGAAGITSGLATAGAVVGGGMVAGIGVLAAPIAILGIAGFALAKRRKQAKLAVALGTALKKLYNIQKRLLENAEYFQKELAGLEFAIDNIASKQK